MVLIDPDWRCRSTVLTPMFLETQASQSALQARTQDGPLSARRGLAGQVRATQQQLDFTPTQSAGNASAARRRLSGQQGPPRRHEGGGGLSSWRADSGGGRGQESRGDSPGGGGGDGCSTSRHAGRLEAWSPMGVLCPPQPRKGRKGLFLIGESRKSLSTCTFWFHLVHHV